MKSPESLVKWGRWYLEDRACLSLFARGLLACSHPCAALNLEDDTPGAAMQCVAGAWSASLPGTVSVHVCRVSTARLDADKIDGYFSTMWRLPLEGYWCVWSFDLEEFVEVWDSRCEIHVWCAFLISVVMVPYVSSVPESFATFLDSSFLRWCSLFVGRPFREEVFL